MTRDRWAAFAILALTCASVSCRKGEAIPTEKVLVAKAASAPGISELTPHMAANLPVYWGEVFLPRNRFPAFSWEGAFEGQPARRTGAIEAARSPVDGPSFVFGSDFLEADVPTSAWLCGKMGQPAVPGMPCQQNLRRTVASSGKLLAYIPCTEPSCPIAELSGSVVTTSAVPALAAVRVVSFGQRQVALAWSHWTRSPEWTGRRVLLFLVSPPLQRIGELSVEELDAREQQVVTRTGTLELFDDGVGFTGRRVVVDRATGAEVSAQPVHERFVLTEEGKLVWKK